MSTLKPSRDIQPVTEFRANAAQFIEQVQATGEPVILTQHGRSAAVLLDVESYEGMLDERALEAVESIGQDRPRTAAVWLERLLACVGPCGSRRRITFRCCHAVRHC